MSYIRIDGLTDNQMKHADALWALQSREDVDYYLNTLSGTDWTDAHLAFYMVAATALDEAPVIDVDILKLIGRQ